MVDPFEIPNPFDEPAGQTFNIYDMPSKLHAEPSDEAGEPSTAPETQHEHSSTPECIGAQEAAEILGMSLNHLRQLTFQKKLTVVKREGRRSLYSLTAITEYKERHAKP